ncbi:DUF192 domain-containing protein [Marixanthomonas spongiae]|uniref:DUF192 domain-containing protein n=1 Tax=Marixanthomonas spongiae TaxID=2174845 RepID=A0A2U0I545_9FLAO|nr:DUF192 domain-containing protein [Marixanthomonas spongiae]PVW16228.1 hypothetical protein DDV96_02860 [Marixanthomonas spongiae]
MKKTLILLLSIAITGAVYSCKDNRNEQKSITKEVQFTKEGELTLKKAKNDSVVATLDIEIADDEYQTQTGLMYRKSMPNNQGMLFIFENEQPRSFYMKNTAFPLDIIYIDSDKKIVSIQKGAKPMDPTSLPSEGPAQYVLEVNAGLSYTWGLEKGDIVAWHVDN